MATQGETRQGETRNRIKVASERVADTMREHCQPATQLVKDQPALSMFVVAGVGFGLGLLLGHALGEPPRDERTAAARFGRNMLDAMARCMPDSMSGR